MRPEDDADPGAKSAPTGDDVEQEDAESDGFAGWRNSTLGAVGTGIARGLHAALARPVDEVVIMASIPGDPPDADQRVRVILDPEDPTKSVAIMPKTTVDAPSEQFERGLADAPSGQMGQSTRGDSAENA